MFYQCAIPAGYGCFDETARASNSRDYAESRERDTVDIPAVQFETEEGIYTRVDDV